MSHLSRRARRALASRAALLCALLPACTPLAGVRAPIVTDRAGVTERPDALAHRTVQVEGGTTVTRANGLRMVSAGELLVRGGIGGRTELRVGLPSYGHVAVHSVRLDGMADASVGAKVALLAPREGGPALLPALSLLVGTTLPTGGPEFGGAAAQPEAALLLGWQPAPRVHLGLNAGYASLADGDQRYGELSGSAAVGVAVLERLGMFAEAHALAPRSRDGSAYVSTGVTWLLGPDVQLDARIGTGVHHAPGERTYGVGFARRF